MDSKIYGNTPENVKTHNAKIQRKAKTNQATANNAPPTIAKSKDGNDTEETNYKKLYRMCPKVYGIRMLKNQKMNIYRVFPLVQFKAFYEYNHGYTKLSTLPQICDVEVTSACNLDCRFCARKFFIMNRGLGFMPLESFKGLVDKYTDLFVHPRLYLHGEPLLHPKLCDMVNYLFREGNPKTLGIVTNGTLLTVNLFEQLVNAGLNYLVVSFEGTSKEDYEYLRRGASFEQTEKNLLDVCNWNYTNGNRVFLRVDIIDTEQTHSKLNKFIRKWKSQNGLNEVNAVTFLDWNQTLNVEGIKPPTYRVESGSDVCPWPWFTINIQFDGGVVPCCHWANAPFGNIFSQSLKKIWNGEKYVAFRKAMLRGKQTHDWCRKCSCVLEPVYEKSRFYPFSIGFFKQLVTWIR